MKSDVYHQAYTKQTNLVMESTPPTLQQIVPNSSSLQFNDPNKYCAL